MVSIVRSSSRMPLMDVESERSFRIIDEGEREDLGKHAQTTTVA